MGFLPQHFRFHYWLTTREFLHLHADLYGIPHAVKRGRIPELLDRVGLASRANKQLRAFSKGMLQRIGLAQALLNEPDLGYAVPNALRGPALMWVNEMLLLNVTLLGGTRLSTLANGVLAFAAYGLVLSGGGWSRLAPTSGKRASLSTGSYRPSL